MDKVTIIIPLHKFEEDEKKYLPRAVESINDLEGIENVSVIAVGPKDVLDAAKETLDTCKAALTSLENDETDFASQVNKAVYSVVDPYFMVLEFDDILNKFALKNLEEYKRDEGDAAVYLTISEMRNTNGDFMSFINEIAWSASFADNIGYIDEDALKSYADFNVTGAFIKTETFLEVGKLKPSFGIAAWYEFLLREAHNDNIIYVIPKIGYVHTSGREDSYFNTFAKEHDAAYISWLVKHAPEEAKYTEERELSYDEKKKA